MTCLNPLRVVQIGTGSTVHAAPVAETVRQLREDYQLLGVVETDPVQKLAAERKTAFQGVPFLSSAEAFALRPDAFLVETDELRLVPTAIRVLEEGFPVFMDKPGSGSSADFHRMCRIAEEKKLPFSTGYMFRGNPAVRKAMEMVNDGLLGRIVSFEGQMSCMGNAGYHEKLKRFPGGMMYYLGCHIIDLMVGFCGFPDRLLPLNIATHACGVECRDHGFCLFRYPDAFGFVKASASEFNGFARRCISLAGTKGAIEIRPLEKPEENGYYTAQLRMTDNNDHPYAEGSKSITFPPFRRYDVMMKDFADYVRGKKENPRSPAYEAELHDLILAAQGDSNAQTDREISFSFFQKKMHEESRNP